MLVYPPIIIISVFIAMICLVVEFSIVNKKPLVFKDIYIDEILNLS